MTLTTPATARKPRRKASRNPLLPTADDIRTGFRLDHQFSNARIEDLETAAAEADLAHDVAQAASNPDVIAALGTNVCLCGAIIARCAACNTDFACADRDCAYGDCLTCAIDSTPHDWNQINRDIAALDPANIANAALPTMPPAIFYTRRGHGFTWGDHPNAYPSYTDAANARDGR